MLPALTVFFGTLLMEVGWVLCVRFVQRSWTTMLVLTTMLMQLIAYLITIIIVDDHSTIVPGVIAAGFGAFVGMKLNLKGP
jgi:hypothetical protein